MCSALANVRFTPESDRESGFPQKVMSAFPPSGHLQRNLECPLRTKREFGNRD